MFERYTEKARRSIFFARYEASRYPTGWIEAEHLLLGLVREDTKLRMRLDNSAEEEIRSMVAGIYSQGPSLSTNSDLPLSQISKQALKQGAEEADRLKHTSIDTSDLVLGLFKVGSVSGMLRKFGVDYESYRRALETTAPSILNSKRQEPEPQEADEQPRPQAQAASLQDTIWRLTQLVEWTVDQCSSQPAAFGDQHLKRKPWSRKEALGHLIDCAMAHQGWMARALTESRPILSGRPEDTWVYEQGYRDYPWSELLDVWESVNLLLIHVLLNVREEKLDTICRIGVEDPLPVRELVMRYVDYCEDIVGQILARG